MARSRLIFHPEAAREVEEARDWYRDGDNLVRVLAVAHDSRRPNYWQSRVKAH